MLYGELPEIKIGTAEEPVRGISFSIPNPPRSAVLRLPTNEELAAYMKRQKNAKPGSYQADLELLKKIKLAGDEFDEFDARIAILKLTDVSVEGSERSGTGFKITLKTPFGQTAHTVEIPSSKKMVTAVRTGRIGSDLYDEVIQGIEGYAKEIGMKDVPEHHKLAVGAELVRLVDSLYEANFVPNS